jgi:hypothetical protein
MSQQWAVTPKRNFRVPDDVWNAAKARADAEGTNLTAVLVAALIEYGQGKPTTERAPRPSAGREDARGK